MKTNMNKVELIGFAGMNPEIRELAGNVKIARFPLATKENYRDKNGDWISNTTWHHVVLWNDNASQAINAIKKGDRVHITGKVSYRTYEASNGEKRFSAEIVAYECKVISKIVPVAE